MAGPLAGRRVLVTRAAHQAGKLSDGLRALGATPVEVPVLEIQPPRDVTPLDAALRRLDSYDWLILTSANAVQAVVRSGLLDQASGLKVAAVGQATAAVARNAGLAVAVVPESYVAESLVAALAGQVVGKRVLLARAEIARDVVPEALRAAGAAVEVVDAYRNMLPEATPALLRAALEQGIDAVTFTSSSSVKYLAEAARQAGAAFPFAGVPAISIGPITSGTLREHGWDPTAEANPFDIPGLIAATLQAIGSRSTKSPIR